MEGTAQLRRVVCPPCKIEGMPGEIFVLPESISEYDQVHKAVGDGEMARAAALTVALRARDSAGKLLFGKGIMPQWERDRGLLKWLFAVAAAIAISDREWEAEQGN